jgi:hypothetical protein
VADGGCGAAHEVVDRAFSDEIRVDWKMIPTVVVIIALVVFLSAEVILHRRRRAAFGKRFPPISDAEFMALCRPGTKPAIALKVRRIMADQLAVEYERIYPSSRIVDDLGAE